MLYIFSRNGHVYHDKACPCVTEISDRDFMASTIPPSDRGACPHCVSLSAIRKGCGNDSRRFSWYQDFLKGKCSTHELLRFVNQNQGTFRYHDEVTLRLTCHEDTWLLRRREDGKYALLHNNYKVFRDGTRIIPADTDFHLQMVLPNINFALRTIGRYDFTQHQPAAGTRGTVLPASAQFQECQEDSSSDSLSQKVLEAYFGANTM